MLNTDINGYLDEYLADGFPASSVRTREFVPRIAAFTNFRDRIVLPYPVDYQRYMMEEKRRIVYKNFGRYHISRLSGDQEFRYLQELQQYPPWTGFMEHASLFELCMGMPSDLVICAKQPSGDYEIDYIHLAFPNGWGANDAIGKPFQYFHENVERTDEKKVVPVSNKFPEFLAQSGKCFERVGAFSIKTTPRLDQHPDDMDSLVFDENVTQMYVRFERQVVLSVPELDSFMFFIQTQLVDLRSKPELILNAIENYSPDAHSVAYRIEDDNDLNIILNYINCSEEKYERIIKAVQSRKDISD